MKEHQLLELEEHKQGHKHKVRLFVSLLLVLVLSHNVLVVRFFFSSQEKISQKFFSNFCRYFFSSSIQ